MTSDRLSTFAVVFLATIAISSARADIPIGFNSALTGPYAWVGEPHLVGTSWRSPTSTLKAGSWASRFS